MPPKTPSMIREEINALAKEMRETDSWISMNRGYSSADKEDEKSKALHRQYWLLWKEYYEASGEPIPEYHERRIAQVEEEIKEEQEKIKKTEEKRMAKIT